MPSIEHIENKPHSDVENRREHSFSLFRRRDDSRRDKVKCKECGKRPKTSDDGLCDSCRYLAALKGILEERAVATVST